MGFFDFLPISDSLKSTPKVETLKEPEKRLVPIFPKDVTKGQQFHDLQVIGRPQVVVLTQK